MINNLIIFGGVYFLIAAVSYIYGKHVGYTKAAILFCDKWVERVKEEF